MAISFTGTGMLTGLCIAASILISLGAQAAEPLPARFSISADGQEVTDTQTKLVWQRCPVGSKWDGKLCSGKPTKFTLQEAKHASDPAGAAWRLPSKDEFFSLADRTHKKPKMDAVAFPAKPKGLCWALRPEAHDNLNAWLVDYRNGKVYGNTSAVRHFVRLVRPA